MPAFYSADRIFTGEQWLHDHAVVVDAGYITDILPAASLPASFALNHFPSCFIAPAFIDLQIYGAFGRLLAVHPSAEAISLLQKYCEGGGAAFCLPTVATNTLDIFYQVIDAVRDYWAAGGKGVLGLHLEGPWINPVKRGAHVEALIHPPQPDEVRALLAYGEGVIRMITLAPEVCSSEVLLLLQSKGIVLSAGHSNARYEEAMESFSRGIGAVTHLYNAMSPLQHRSPGLVGATLDHAQVMASIIPDGHHVDYAAIRIAKKVMKERLFVITDAVTDTTEGYYQHQRVGDKYEAAGILSGSALTMIAAVQNLVTFAGIDLGEALRMCSLYPARVLGLKNQGRIEKGQMASMVVIDDKLNVKQLL